MDARSDPGDERNGAAAVRAAPIFDGHNDILSKLVLAGHNDPLARFRSDPNAAIDATRARRGGFAGGLFALWVPSELEGSPDFASMAEARFDVPLPPEVPQSSAVDTVMRQIALALALERAGDVVLCRSVPEIEAAVARGTLAVVLHMEGAEAIDLDFALLDVLHAAGLRSLGPVWSRPNRFGHGVPFRFPSSPDTGEGLTPDGLRLVDRCEALSIMIDVSHLNEAGFWDVAGRTSRPIVATHSNAHALCATARNLTDRQLDAIAESGGMVGLNFATAFLREDGRMVPEVPISRLIAHIDHLMARLGEDGVGLGSDYDGAVVPSELTGVECLPRLREAMARHGYDLALIDKLCRANWLRMLALQWGDPAR